MNAMHAVISGLSRSDGVRGAAVVTEDGMMVADALNARFDSDVVAGLASFVIATTRRVMLADGYDRLDRFVVHATHGKFVLTDIGGAFLIAITDQFVQLEPLLVIIDEATERLRQLARMPD